MIPAAVVEVLTEGLMFIRRALSLYNKVENATTVIDSITESFDDELRHHRSVLGEELYLFILGRETIRQVAPPQAIPSSDTDQIVLEAIQQHMMTSTSADLRSTVVSFASALGQAAQDANYRFADWCEESLQHGQRSYQLVDPVYDFFVANGSATPEPIVPILEALGVARTAWQYICNSVEDSMISKGWRISLESAPNRVQPYRHQTFVGLVLRGALSVKQDVENFIPATVGDAAIAIDASYIKSGERIVPAPPMFSDSRSITKEMIDATSRRIMASRGYVNTDTGYAHVSETSMEKDKDGTVTYKSRNSFVVGEPNRDKNKSTSPVSPQQAIKALEWLISKGKSNPSSAVSKLK
jgi:hypothetical protein